MHKYKAGEIKSYNDWVDAIEIADNDMQMATDMQESTDTQEVQERNLGELGPADTATNLGEDSTDDTHDNTIRKSKSRQVHSQERNGESPTTYDHDEDEALDGRLFDPDQHIDWGAMEADGLFSRGSLPMMHDK